MRRSYKPGDPYYIRGYEPPWRWVRRIRDDPYAFSKMLCNVFYIAHRGQFHPNLTQWYCECMAELIRIGHVGPDWPDASIMETHGVKGLL